MAQIKIGVNKNLKNEEDTIINKTEAYKNA